MEFKRQKVTNAETFLEAAVQAEQYVSSFLVEDEDGLHSQENKGASQDNLYVGTAGILHMYVELDQSKRDVSYEDKIHELTRYLNIHLFDGIHTARIEGELVPGMAEAFYTGIGGIGLVLNEVYRHYKDENAKGGSKKIVTYYKEHATKAATGIFWSDNSPIFFDGGIVLFLLDTIKTFEELREELQPLVEQATSYILSHGTFHEDGGLELDYHHVDFKHKEPNFEFGTAGLGYLFAKVYELTGEEKYLNAAKATTIYLKSIAVPQKNGYLIPYKLGHYDDLFYLGNCHGPVGTAKLFYELFTITKAESYLEEVLRLVEGAQSLGAPFAQSPGFWNTVCICCGPAGYLPLYVGLYRITKDVKWKEAAYGVGEILVGSQRNHCWEIAFDRTKPDVITRPAGYFTGAAGVAVALLQLYHLLTDEKWLPGLIDDPYQYIN